ncbi:MAG TPA: DUF4382 domain-containing protein [Steroidobacteraceae bacterium]|nr:DUF4382 domain-containing protein [Steroidobacteraceae bacterium]
MAYDTKFAALLLATAALGSCSAPVTVNLTDTPVDDATSVVIDFTGVDLHNTNGSTFSIRFPSPRQIDLLTLQNGLTGALLQSESVPAGNYDSMQLNVLADKDTQGESYITLNTGAQYPLYIPSGSETGLKLLTPFTVVKGQPLQFIIEFDLRQSITGTDGQNYLLVPALRLEDQSQVGTVSASVDFAAIAAQQLAGGTAASQCNPGVFLFSGDSVTPQNGGGTALVDFQPVEITQSLVSIPYVAAGSYTLAATCNYDLYDPAAVPGQSGYQTLHWTVQGSVSVTANSTTVIALPSATTSNLVN